MALFKLSVTFVSMWFCGIFVPPTVVCQNSGGEWSLLASSEAWTAREGFGVTLIPGTSRIVLFGGFSSSAATLNTALNDIYYSSLSAPTSWIAYPSSAPWSKRGYFAFTQPALIRDANSSTNDNSTSSSAAHSPSSTPIPYFLFGGWDGFRQHNDIWSTFNGFDWKLVTAAAPWAARSGFGGIDFSAVQLSTRCFLAGGVPFNQPLDLWMATLPSLTNWTLITSDLGLPNSPSNQLTAFSIYQQASQLFILAFYSLPPSNIATQLLQSSDGITWVSPPAAQNALVPPFSFQQQMQLRLSLPVFKLAERVFVVQLLGPGPLPNYLLWWSDDSMQWFFSAIATMTQRSDGGVVTTGLKDMAALVLGGETITPPHSWTATLTLIDVSRARAIETSSDDGTGSISVDVDPAAQPSLLNDLWSWKALVPTAPTGVNGSIVLIGVTIAVQWLAVNITDDGGVPIHSYTATASNADFKSSLSCVVANTGLSQFACNITNLRASTNYTLSVVATNMIGDSLPSDSIQLTTHPLPPAPQNVSVSNNDDGDSADVYWLGVDVDPPVKLYTVTAVLNDSSGQIISQCHANATAGELGSPFMSCRLFDLLPPHPDMIGYYLVSAVATNNIGDSLASAPLLIGPYGPQPCPVPSSASPPISTAGFILIAISAFIVLFSLALALLTSLRRTLRKRRQYLHHPLAAQMLHTLKIEDGKVNSDDQLVSEESEKWCEWLDGVVEQIRIRERNRRREQKEKEIRIEPEGRNEFSVGDEQHSKAGSVLDRPLCSCDIAFGEYSSRRRVFHCVDELYVLTASILVGIITVFHDDENVQRASRWTQACQTFCSSSMHSFTLQQLQLRTEDIISCSMEQMQMLLVQPSHTDAQVDTETEVDTQTKDRHNARATNLSQSRSTSAPRSILWSINQPHGHSQSNNHSGVSGVDEKRNGERSMEYVLGEEGATWKLGEESVDGDEDALFEDDFPEGYYSYSQSHSSQRGETRSHSHSHSNSNSGHYVLFEGETNDRIFQQPRRKASHTHSQSQSRPHSHAHASPQQREGIAASAASSASSSASAAPSAASSSVSVGSSTASSTSSRAYSSAASSSYGTSAAFKVNWDNRREI